MSMESSLAETKDEMLQILKDKIKLEGQLEALSLEARQEALNSTVLVHHVQHGISSTAGPKLWGQGTMDYKSQKLKTQRGIISVRATWMSVLFCSQTRGSALKYQKSLPDVLEIIVPFILAQSTL